MDGEPQMVHERVLEAPRARAESWATVGRGPVQPAVMIDIVMMTNDMDLRFFMRKRIGGLDYHGFGKGACGAWKIPGESPRAAS